MRGGLRVSQEKLQTKGQNPKEIPVKKNLGERSRSPGSLRSQEREQNDTKR